MLLILQSESWRDARGQPDRNHDDQKDSRAHERQGSQAGASPRQSRRRIASHVSEIAVQDELPIDPRDGAVRHGATSISAVSISNICRSRRGSTPTSRSAASDGRRCQIAELSAAAMAVIAAIRSSVDISLSLLSPSCATAWCARLGRWGSLLQQRLRVPSVASIACRAVETLAPGSKSTPRAVGVELPHARL